MKQKFALLLVLFFAQSAFGQLSTDHYWLLNQNVSVIAKLESIQYGDASTYFQFKCLNGEDLTIAWWDFAEEQSGSIQVPDFSEDQIEQCFELKLRCVKKQELNYQGFEAGMVPTGNMQIAWEIYSIDRAACWEGG